MNATKTMITVETTVNVPLEKAWNLWTQPAHITNWSYASDDWYCPYAENDLRENGKFKIGMAAKDKSMSFDFEGHYTDVRPMERILFTIADGREVDIQFIDLDGSTRVIETFEAEGTNSVEMQRGGWQAIMDNYKKYTESKL